MNSLAAIILAAGKGTRMKSGRAKVTFPLADKPMIQRVVDTALAIDCKKVCVVVGYQKESVIACLDDDARLSFIEQEQQLGTGHAVLITETAFPDPQQDVLILCGDVPLLSTATITDLYQQHVSSMAVCTVLTAFLDDPGKYGRIIRDAAGKLHKIVEYKDASEAQRAVKEWNTGIYCFKAGDLFSCLKQTSTQNQQGEYYLTDVVEMLHNQGKTVSSVVLENLMEVSGVNSQEQLAELEAVFVDNIRRKWLNSGVIMHNPSSIYISDESELEPDVEIFQNCILKGNCLLESGSVIGPNSYLENSRICTDTILQGYNILVNAIIHEHEILEYGTQVLEEHPDE